MSDADQFVAELEMTILSDVDPEIATIEYFNLPIEWWMETIINNGYPDPA